MTDFSLCLICQKEKSEQLVYNPSSHEKLLKFVEEWAKYVIYDVLICGQN